MAGPPTNHPAFQYNCATGDALQAGMFVSGGGDGVHLPEVEPVFRVGVEVLAAARRGGAGDALAVELVTRNASGGIPPGAP